MNCTALKIHGHTQLDLLLEWPTACLEGQPSASRRGGWGPVCSNLGLKPGQRLTVKGKVAPNAKSFVMNLGKDATLLGLHFNPRFDAHGDVNTIVCNSKKVEEWGAEHREAVFPFQKGGTAEITFAVNQNDVTVHLPGHQFTFPNRLNLSVFDYFDTQGDFTLQSISWE